MTRFCIVAFAAAAAGFTARPALRGPARGARLVGPPLCQEAVSAGPTLDLVGDGGVVKSVLTPGAGAAPTRGSSVEVHYEGQLAETGAVFDSSRARGKPFKFVLGEGKVIGGWEVGVSSMRVGEVATLTCSPQYAYGAKGIPPMIPPSAALRFDVELLSVTAPLGQAETFADDNPLSPRTPGAIKQAYEQRMAAKQVKKEGFEGLVEWAKGIYIFGLFSSKGETPPWYLNPLITFPAIFAIVGVGFALVVALGGLHRGELPQAGDDLSSFIGETLVP